MTKPAFRFAPSSNGPLHLGHAFSSLLNYHLAQASAAHFLLRIENIDTTRCTLEREADIYRDLEWLGLNWETPVRRQVEHFDDYQHALQRLIEAGLVYPSFLSRGEVSAYIAETEGTGRKWAVDPEGVSLFPPIDRNRTNAERKARMAAGEPYAWRLDMAAACRSIGKVLHWDERGEGPEGQTGSVAADPMAWGDVVIARKEFPTSYHLAVVVDDALQDTTNIVRGRDLFHATSVHRVLQELLNLPAPNYYHHKLLMDQDGRKLSKSAGSTALASLREMGATPDDVIRLIDFEPPLAGIREINSQAPERDPNLSLSF